MGNSCNSDSAKRVENKEVSKIEKRKEKPFKKNRELNVSDEELNSDEEENGDSQEDQSKQEEKEIPEQETEKIELHVEFEKELIEDFHTRTIRYVNIVGKSDNVSILTCSYDKTLCLISPVTGEVINRVTDEFGMCAGFYDKDNDMLVATNQNGKAFIMSYPNLEILHEFRVCEGSDSQLSILENLEYHTTFKNSFVTACEHGTNYWDLYRIDNYPLFSTRPNEIQTTKIFKGDLYIFCICEIITIPGYISFGYGRYVFSGERGYHVILFNLEQNEVEKKFEDLHDHPVRCITSIISPKDSKERIISMSYHQIILWLLDGEVDRIIKTKHLLVYCSKLHDHVVIFGGSEKSFLYLKYFDNENIKFFNLTHESQEVKTLNYNVQILKQQRKIMCTRSSDKIVIWKLHNKELLEDIRNSERQNNERNSMENDLKERIEYILQDMEFAKTITIRINKIEIFQMNRFLYLL